MVGIFNLAWVALLLVSWVCPCSCSASHRYTRFAEELRDQGARVDEQVHMEAQPGKGNILVTSRDLIPGENFVALVAHIPDRMILSRHWCYNRLVSALSVKQLEHLATLLESQRIILVPFCLLLEKHARKPSFGGKWFATYIEILEEVPVLPFFYRDLFQQAEGSYLLEHALHQKERYRQIYDVLYTLIELEHSSGCSALDFDWHAVFDLNPQHGGELLSFHDELSWAVSIIRSRAFVYPFREEMLVLPPQEKSEEDNKTNKARAVLFSVLQDDVVSSAALVPFIDMANTAFGEARVLDYMKSNPNEIRHKGFNLFLRDRTLANTELTIDYGAKCNSHLLLFYGFTFTHLDDNTFCIPETYTIDSLLRFSANFLPAEADMLYEKVTFLLKQYGLPPNNRFMRKFQINFRLYPEGIINVHEWYAVKALMRIQHLEANYARDSWVPGSDAKERLIQEFEIDRAAADAGAVLFVRRLCAARLVRQITAITADNASKQATRGEEEGTEADERSETLPALLQVLEEKGTNDLHQHRLAYLRAALAEQRSRSRSRQVAAGTAGTNEEVRRDRGDGEEEEEEGDIVGSAATFPYQPILAGSRFSSGFDAQSKPLQITIIPPIRSNDEKNDLLQSTLTKQEEANEKAKKFLSFLQQLDDSSLQSAIFVARELVLEVELLQHCVQADFRDVIRRDKGVL